MTANHLILMFSHDDETRRFFDSQKRIFLLNPRRKFELLRSMAYTLRARAFKGLTNYFTGMKNCTIMTKQSRVVQSRLRLSTDSRFTHSCFDGVVVVLRLGVSERPSRA